MKILLDVEPRFLGPLTQGIECRAIRLVEQPDGAFALGVVNEEQFQEARQQAAAMANGSSGPGPGPSPGPGELHLPADVRALLCDKCGMPRSGHKEPCR